MTCASRVFHPSWGLLIVAAAMTMTTLSACTASNDVTRPTSDDPAIAAIYAEADAKAAQKRAQELKAAATNAVNATATAAYAPFALQTQTAQNAEATQISAAATAAPVATAERAAQMALAQTATAIPLATANAAIAQTASAAPVATQQAQQMVAAQTAAVAPTATWQAFQLEEARRTSQVKTAQESAALSRLLDVAGTSALIVLVVLGVVIGGRQIAKALTQTVTQTVLARATAAKTIEQARAETERERQKAEEARGRASLARPPVYVIEAGTQASARATAHVVPEQMRFAGHTQGAAYDDTCSDTHDTVHGDNDILLIWETQWDDQPGTAANPSAGDLAHTGSIVIDAVKVTQPSRKVR